MKNLIKMLYSCEEMKNGGESDSEEIIINALSAIFVKVSRVEVGAGKMKK